MKNSKKQESKKKKTIKVKTQKTKISKKSVSTTFKKDKEKISQKSKIIKKLEEKKQVLKINTNEGITPQEISQKINQPVSKIITEFIKLGVIVSANQKVFDKDALILVLGEFGYELEFEDQKDALAQHPLVNQLEEKIEKIETISIQPKIIKEKVKKEIPPNFVKKIPVVTVMGHVDHGKTTLLDTIRKTNVATQEVGFITQHIGAYKVNTSRGNITFIDTPGHEAFSAIRARGAKVTDIVVIVVAGDEGVMPQTVESLNHAKSANVPIIVAINKIDLPQCNINKVKQQFADMGYVASDWGGDTEFVEISARNNINIDKLLDTILLKAELMDLYVPIDVFAEATVIETKLDRKSGYLATIIVSKGKLKVGDNFVCGNSYGKVRAMFNENLEKIYELYPGEPAEILGFETPTNAGEILKVVKDEKEAKRIYEEIVEKQKIESSKLKRHLSIQDIISGKSKILSLILKADTNGSLDAINKMLSYTVEEFKNNPDLPQLKVINSGVGEINESDVLLATASNAIIIGFNVRPNIQALKNAKHEGIEIKTYRLIYELIDDIKNILQKHEIKQKVEEFLGRARVKKIFDIQKVGKIAGCFVENGKIVRNAKVRILRDNVIISETKINSLKRFKEDVKEVQQGYECGISLDNFQDIRENDIIECYHLIEK